MDPGGSRHHVSTHKLQPTALNISQRKQEQEVILGELGELGKLHVYGSFGGKAIQDRG